MRLTQKEVKKSFKQVIKVPYCMLQNLLCDDYKIGHTERVEGWASDIYDCGLFAISMGYSPFGVMVDYDLLRQYDKKAYDIKCNTMCPDAQLNQLFDEFRTNINNILFK